MPHCLCEGLQQCVRAVCLLGAERWMFHMRAQLQATEREWNKIDERIYPCVVDYLHIKMQKYAAVHRWEFQESDFVFEKAEKKKSKGKFRGLRSENAVTASDAPQKPQPDESKDAGSSSATEANGTDDVSVPNTSSSCGGGQVNSNSESAPSNDIATSCGGRNAAGNSLKVKSSASVSVEKMPVSLSENDDESARDPVDTMEPIPEGH